MLPLSARNREKRKVQRARDEEGKVRGEVKGKWKLREKEPHLRGNSHQLQRRVKHSLSCRAACHGDRLITATAAKAGCCSQPGLYRALTRYL